MAQHFSDLAERCPLPQHLGRQSMAKLMGSVSGSLQAGALEAMSNDRSHATGALKAAEGRFGAQKDTPAGMVRPFTPQIRGDRLANFRRQG